jgi:hypothetical protein
MRRNLLLTLIIFSAFCLKAAAQQFVLSGKITDKKSSAISFVSVYIKNSTYGTTSNEDGIYQFKLTPGTYSIVYRFVGYQERIEKVTITDHDELRNVQLQNEVFTLRQADIKDGPGRDTTAQGIMRKVIDKRKFYLNEVKSYSCVV